MNEDAARRAVESYMLAFNRRDMQALGKLLSEDASLTDWEVSAAGREAMLAATEDIVSGARIHISVRQLIVDLPVAAADLSVRVNDEIELDVIDLFEFDDAGLIKSVRAFKGPERRI